jgi:predicted transglutaminase-like cysteine proteinase
MIENRAAKMSVFTTSRGLICVYLVALAGLSFNVSAANAAEKNVVVANQTTSSLSPAASAPMRYFTINQVLAQHDGRATAENLVRLASIDPSETAVSNNIAPDRSARTDEPFGLLTFRAPEGLLWIKWRKLEGEIRADERVISDCRADPDQCSSPAARRFLDLLDSARDMSMRVKIATINRSINLQIRYVSDLRQHGVVDLWSAPLATFTGGEGDCEDYAIAKYVALRELGVKADDLRLLLVRDRAVGLDHAVLGVRHDGRWLILDNRHSLLLEMTEVPQFTPLFAINYEGVKLFAALYANRPQGEVEMVPAAPGDYW